MEIRAEIHDYSEPRQSNIKIYNSWNHGELVELEIDGKRCKVNGQELISAVKRCMLDTFGK